MRIGKMIVELLNQDTELEIHVNKQGLFFTKWPAELHQLMNGHYNREFKTKDELEEYISATVKEANNITEEVDYRIYYKIEDPNTPTISLIYLPLKAVKRGDRTIFFWLHYDVFWRESDGPCETGVNPWRVLKNRHENGYAKIDTNHSPYLPFTKENIEFFKGLEVSIFEIRKKMKEFFDHKDLQKMILTGNQKLL